MTETTDRLAQPADAASGSSHRDPELVTVLIPCRNGGEMLVEQLESLAGQDFDRPYEVIIADNGSTDDSVSVALGFRDRIPGLRALDVSATPGRGNALNAALPHVAGERLVIIDADDVLDPGFLTAMDAALQEHAFVGARMDAALLNSQAMRRRRRDLQVQGLPVLMNHLPFVIGASMGVRTSALEDVGGFNQAFTNNQDVDLSWRLQYAGYAPHFVPDAVIHYRYRPTLRDTFRQERGYGAYSALLYREHRQHGLPRRRFVSTARGWAELVLALVGVLSESGRARLVTRAGAALGRLEGSWRHRVVYL